MSSIVNTPLPEDAIMEILSRLPVKSLSRFKCVSKPWHALITDPRFIIRHFIDTGNPEFLLISHLSPVNRQVFSVLSSQTPKIQRKCFQLSNVNNFVEGTLSHTRISGPCNGVFCLFDGKDGIALWNPATQQLNFLPESLIDPPLGSFPLDICVGFGFDAKNNDYKVLVYKQMCFPSSVTIAHVELYLSKTSKWKEIHVGEEFQATGNMPYSSSNPTIDGIFSWFEIDNHVEKVIFSFDMINEVFIKTQLPDYEGLPSKRVHGSLASLKNALAFIHYPLGGVSKCFDVWVLGDYGVRESWTKQLSIGPIMEVAAPLGFWRNGELLLKHNHGKLVSYDPLTETMIDFQANGVKFNHLLQVVPYKESLVCVKAAEDESEQDGIATPFSLCECEGKDII